MRGDLFECRRTFFIAQYVQFCHLRAEHESTSQSHGYIEYANRFGSSKTLVSEAECYFHGNKRGQISQISNRPSGMVVRKREGGQYWLS